MTEEQQERLGFREWTTHYEKEQEADRDKINSVVESVGSLSNVVHRMSANMETMLDNQKGMFNRINRPWQWGVVVAIFMAIFSMSAMFGTMATLIVGPLKESISHTDNVHALDVERDLALHIWMRTSIDTNNEALAANQVDIDWLKKMESRANRRIHSEKYITTEQ